MPFRPEGSPIPNVRSSGVDASDLVTGEHMLTGRGDVWPPRVEWLVARRPKRVPGSM